MLLFDNIEREYFGPRKGSQSSYDFLNQSTRDRVVIIRSIAEDWFLRYPESEKECLLRDLRASDERQHVAASFELMVHELFIRHGFDMQVHPELPGASNKRPDFLALCNGKKYAYIECVNVGDSDQDVGSESLLNDLVERLNQLCVVDFFLGLTVEKSSSKNPSAKRIRRKVQNWINGLTYDYIVEQSKLGKNNRPTIYVKDSDWEFKFFAKPVAEDKRGTNIERPIGMLFPEARWGGSMQSIRRALSQKATRYGNLNIPFIIAINNTSVFGSEDDVFDALIGPSVVKVNIDTGESQTERKPEGSWFGPDGPRNTRVSGILSVNQFFLWAMMSSKAIFWFNPYASEPLDPEFWKGECMVPDMECHEFKLKNGKDLKTLLELPQELEITDI